MVQTVLCSDLPLVAQVFKFPTDNRALLEKGGEERFYVATPGKGCMSGSFGCVRSSGWQMHEGLDIKCLNRDKKGEPSDVVSATAAGAVAYFNTKPGLSNYGRYVILMHSIDGVEVYSLYAHLSAIRDGLAIGQQIKQGEAIGQMGRSTNTRQPITKDRAHVHFELNLLLNERFVQWHKATEPNQRNDHGIWNGHNIVGLDPSVFLKASYRQGSKINLREMIQAEPELCRVWVRKAQFPYLKRYATLVQAPAQPGAIVGYEVALDFNGVPIRLVPRTEAESKGRPHIQLLAVNEQEYNRAPCRKLVRKNKGHWELGQNGQRLIDLLVY